MAERKRMTREEREESAKKRVNKMLDRDAVNVKAVIANTIETRRVASKLPVIDVIFNNARANVGYRVSVEDFNAIHENFKIAEDALQAIIDTAIEKGIFAPREEKTVSEFSKHKEKMIELIKAGKTDDEIKAAIGVDGTKADGWISTVKGKLKSSESTGEKESINKKVA